MVHSEVYLNTCGQHSAVFPATIQKTALFCMFSLFNFLSIFRWGGQLTPFAPVRTPMSSCHNMIQLFFPSSCPLRYDIAAVLAVICHLSTQYQWDAYVI